MIFHRLWRHPKVEKYESLPGVYSCWNEICLLFFARNKNIYNRCCYTYLQTDKTTTELTKITEDYGLQAAAGHKKANDLQRVVKDNIGKCDLNVTAQHLAAIKVSTNYSGTPPYDRPVNMCTWLLRPEQKLVYSYISGISSTSLPFQSARSINKLKKNFANLPISLFQIKDIDT